LHCINCGSETKDNLIVCSTCSSVDQYVQFLKGHNCGSFLQKKDDLEGVCSNYFLCSPIKKALKKEALIEVGLGHVVCPHPEINLSRIIHGGIPEKFIENIYSE